MNYLVLSCLVCQSKQQQRQTAQGNATASQDSKTDAHWTGLAEASVYHAHVTSEEETKECKGSTEPRWKSRLGNHLSSFSDPRKKNKTSLARYIWDLKERNQPFEVKWTLHKQAFPCKCWTKKCDICLSEKLDILRGDPRTMLNKKSEIMNKCLHRAKYKLSAVKWTLNLVPRSALCKWNF